MGLRHECGGGMMDSLMSEDKNKQPYKMLGARLKTLRQSVYESLAEVSGALEIEATTLAKIEQGNLHPSEETLLLLMTHFAVKDDEATKIWQLAGYSEDKMPVSSATNEIQADTKPQVLIAANDARTVYTDQVHVMVNNYGVVMNFMQNGGSNQPNAVARVGMSRQHAESVLKVLQQTLEQSKVSQTPKILPAPENQDK